MYHRFPFFVVSLLFSISLVITTPHHGAAADASRALAPYQPPSAPDPSSWPRERLIGFMNELIDFVYDHHIVKDPSRAVYGMTYEFYKDGKQIQTFTLDAMHDGGWFMGAMAAAHRALPAAGYLDRIRKYQVPFYVNALNNSDRLFPAMQAGKEDRKPFPEPVKGWLPRGWDDGLGFNNKTGRPFTPGYDTTSNHLLQDMADSLLNVWMSTRDPGVAEAIMNIQRYRKEYFGNIPPIANAAGIVANQPELWAVYNFPPFAPQRLKAGYPHLYEGKGLGIPPYNDDLAWAYRVATSRYLATGEFPEEFAREAATQILGAMTLMEHYHDDAPWPYGFYLFEIQKRPAFLDGQGKLDAYDSARDVLYSARGTELAWVGAGLLPLLKNKPVLWESDYRSHHATDTLVRIIDTPPAIDGQRDSLYDQSQPLRSGQDQITLLSDPKNLYLFIESDRPELNIEITPADAVITKEKPRATLKLTRNAAPEITNGRGEALLYHSFTANAAAAPTKRWAAELRIPYSAVPDQMPWLNGTDFGRYTITINGVAPHRTVYLLSSPERLIRRLESHALGSIQNWHDYFRAKGFIPSGTYGLGKPAHSWDMSDAGNVAHLVQTIALWLIYQDGTTEWELIKKQFPATPLPAQPLPASVLKAQDRWCKTAAGATR